MTNTFKSHLWESKTNEILIFILVIQDPLRERIVRGIVVSLCMNRLEDKCNSYSDMIPENYPESRLL